jgi:peptide/nickel transport system substrate-binding protein
MVEDNKTRRRILRVAGAAGIVLVSGCAGNESADSEGGKDGSADDGNEGDDTTDGETTELVLGAAETPNTLNPIRSRSSIGWIMHNWMYSNLVQYDSNLELYDDLAEDWESNSSADSFTFMLRDDATYHHNGEPVVADDVKATIDAIYDPEFASPGEGALGPIESVEVVDESTVTVNTETPYSDLPKMMAEKYPRIIPRDVIENNFDSLSSNDFGSGPYTLQNAEFGTRFEFKKNPDYYMTDDNGSSLPHIDRVVVRTMPETESRMTALQNEEIDMLDAVPPEQVERVQNMQGITFNSKSGGRHYPIDLRTDTEPFDDNRVRQAIKYAIDKEEMLNVVNNGRGVVAQHNQISPAHEFYADLPDMFGVNAEPEQAEDLLSEAGYEGGINLDFSMIVPTEIDAQVERTAVLAQDQLGSVGIEFEIERVPWETFLSEYTAEAPMTTTVWSMRTVEYELLYLLNHSEGGLNSHTRFDDQEFEDALANAAAATSTEEKSQYYEECQRIIQERGGYVIPFFADVLGAWTSELENYGMDPTLATIKLQAARMS